jgi:hypothetical protein
MSPTRTSRWCSRLRPMRPSLKSRLRSSSLFKVEVKSVQILNVKGKVKRFGKFRPPQRLEEGLRVPQAGPGNQLCRRGGEVMALVKVKPTSAGRRAVVKVVNPICTRANRLMRWSRSRPRTPAVTMHGRITTRHKGGGHKQHYRVVDFRRNKDGIPAKVERIEYDPNRSVRTSRCCATPTASAATSSPRGLGGRQQLISGRKRRSRRATPCRCATFRSVRRSTASK